MNEERCRRLVERAIATLELDLHGLCVLTEAATGYYALTPLIAALAGADAVLALTRDSRYGAAADVRRRTEALADRWGVAGEIDVVLDRADERISRADVVTNSGFVRPLDAAFLRRLKSTAAVALMYETWEYRSEDVDLAACRQLGIPVLGTDEGHPALGTIAYVGTLALKLLFELHIEVLNADVVVVGGGPFGRAAEDALRRAGANVRRCTVEALGALDADVFDRTDALVVAEYTRSDPIIGPEGAVDAERLHSANPGLVVAHIAGNVDRHRLEQAGVRCWPAAFAPAGYMSVATDYLGPRPLVDLHAAGLKVGAVLAHGRRRGLDRAEAEAHALRSCDCCQAFPAESDHARR